MKKLSVLVFTFMPIALWAQVASPTPDAIDNIISFLLGIASGIPAIGSYVAIALKCLGVLTVVLTSVSAVLIALSAALNKVGLASFAGYIQKILPYVAFASNFNIQKKV